MAIQTEVSARITVRLLAISARFQCWGRSQPTPGACDRLPAQSTTLAQHESMPLFQSSRCTLPPFVTDRRRAIQLLSYSLHAPIIAPIRALKWCNSARLRRSRNTRDLNRSMLTRDCVCRGGLVLQPAAKVCSQVGGGSECRGFPQGLRAQSASKLISQEVDFEGAFAPALRDGGLLSIPDPGRRCACPGLFSASPSGRGTAAGFN